MASTSLSFKLLGIDVSASRSLERVGDAAGKAQDDLDEFGRSGRQIEGHIGSASHSAEGLSGHFKALGGAAVAAGGLIVGALGASIAQALDFKEATNRLNAQLGSTPAEAARFGKAAGDLYASGLGEGMADTATAVKAVVQNIHGMRTASEPEIEAVGKSALVLADIMDSDVGEVTKAVGQMMKTGLADNATEAFDIITVGFQHGADASGDLLDTFNEYGTQFRKLGLDGETAMGLISQGLQGGARDADLVADAFKEFSLRAISGSTETAQAFQGLGLNAKELTATFARGGPEASAALDKVIDALNGMEDPVKRNAIGVALFGTQWEDLGDAFRSLDVSTAVAGLGQVQGAAANAATQLSGGATASLTRLRREAEMLGVSLVNQLVPPMATATSWIADQLKPALTDAGGAFGTLGPNVTSLGATLQNLAQGAVGQLVAAFRDQALPLLRDQVVPLFRDQVIPAVQSLATWIGDTLVPAVIRIYTAVIENLKPALQGVYDAIEENKPQLQAFWAGLKDIADVIVQVVEFAIRNNLILTIKAAGETIQGIIVIISSLMQAFGQLAVVVATIALSVIANFREIFNAAVTLASGVINVMALLPGPLGAPWRAAKEAVDTFKNNVDTQLTAAEGRVRTARDSINTWLDGIRDKTVTLTLVERRQIYTQALPQLSPGAAARNYPSGLATGGPVHAGMLALVGEEGPELVRFGAAGTVIPADVTRAILGGAGTFTATSRPTLSGRYGAAPTIINVVVHAPVAGNVTAERDLAESIAGRVRDTIATRISGSNGRRSGL